MVEINNNAETGYTLLHVTQDGSPLHRRPRALRAGLRLRRAVDHRHDQRRRRPARRRALLPGPGRLPDGHRLPAEAGHGQGQGPDRRVQGRAPGPAQPVAWRPRRTRPTSPSPSSRSSGSRRPASTTCTIDQIDQGNYILTAAARATSRCSSGATTAASTSTSSTSGGTRRARCPVGQLALNFGRIKDPRSRQAARREPRPRPTRPRRRRSPKTSTSCSPSSATTSGARYTIWGIAHKPDVQGIEQLHPARRQHRCSRCGHRRHLLPTMTVWRGGQ